MIAPEVRVSTFQASKFIFRPQQTSRQRILSLPVLAALCWLCLQKGCIWNPDISPAHALVDTNPTVVSGQEAAASGGEEAAAIDNRTLVTPMALPNGDQMSPNPSLRQASTLLRQAATLLDRNDRAAIRLILQAITILKQEIMQDVQGLEYDRISLSLFPSAHDELRQELSALFSSLRHQRSQHPLTIQNDNQLPMPISRSADRSIAQDRQIIPIK